MKKSVAKKSESLANKAFAYHVNGYSIMPLKKDKRPVLSSWKAYQTEPATEHQVQKWWKANPEHNIGIITGKISGITVVDIDTSGGKAVSLDTFPKTYTVITPTGGYHLYYKYDPRIQQTANTYPQFPHVDIRNDGGYVVAPPSIAEYTKNKEEIHGAYKVHISGPIADFPTDLFIKPAPGPSKATVANALKGFDKMAEGDGRNVALTKVVGKIIRLTAGDATLAWAMTLSANLQFKKPLAEKEARIIFDSIIGKDKKKPLSQVEFIMTDKGAIIANTENVFRTLQYDITLEGHFRYNTFNGALETNYEHTKWEPFQRGDVIRIRGYLMSTYPHFTKIGHSEVEDAMVRVAEANKISPPVEWMKTLEWDKKKRLDTWLSSVGGVEDNKYHTAVGSNWFKGMVKRLVQPGCKFDYVLVLEGKQGIGKSTLFAILGGDWHVETVFSPDNKDFFMLFAGNSIVEFSEGETLSRTEAKKLKAVITMQNDKYRPPYERSTKEFPRQCVFAMTTNQEQYLKDETGNRRWLPVAINQKINHEWLIENRDQLYAEAYHRVINLKETIYEFPDEDTKTQQEMRQIADPRQEIISEWYYTVLDDEKRAAGITTRQAFVGAIEGGFGTGRQMERAEEMIISSILRDGLKLEKRREMRNGTRYYLYYPSIESEANKLHVDVKEGVKTKEIF